MVQAVHQAPRLNSCSYCLKRRLGPNGAFFLSLVLYLSIFLCPLTAMMREYRPTFSSFKLCFVTPLKILCSRPHNHTHPSYPIHRKVKASSTAKGTILEVLAALLNLFPSNLVNPEDRKPLGESDLGRQTKNV